MSAVLVNHAVRQPQRVRVQKIASHLCEQHECARCPGTLPAGPVRFECTCHCHSTGPLFGGAR